VYHLTLSLDEGVKPAASKDAVDAALSGTLPYRPLDPFEIGFAPF
jgi:hypothetical protein